MSVRLSTQIATVGAVMSLRTAVGAALSRSFAIDYRFEVALADSFFYYSAMKIFAWTLSVFFLAILPAALVGMKKAESLATTVVWAVLLLILSAGAILAGILIMRATGTRLPGILPLIGGIAFLGVTLFLELFGFMLF